MLYNVEEIKKELRKQYKNSLKNKMSKYIKVDEQFIGADIYNLDKNNLAKFLRYSNPSVIFSDDLVHVKGFGDIYGFMLKDLNVGSFVDEYRKNDYFDVDQSIKEKVFFRKKLEKNIDSLAEEFVKDMNKRVKKF